MGLGAWAARRVDSIFACLLFRGTYTLWKCTGAIFLLAERLGTAMDNAKVTTRLDGGLGNQMFQYAVGRCLSLRHNAPLYMDIGVYRSYTSRQYSLGVFNVAAETVPLRDPPSLLESLPLQKAGRRLGNLARRLPSFASSAISGLVARKNVAMLEANATQGFGLPRREKQQFEFDQGILEIAPPVYLVGFWQNEQYFAACQNAIREDFTLRLPASPKAENYRSLIMRQPCASLHIRRGDYVRGSASTRLNVCGLDYYNNALQLLRSIVPEVHIFAFSDEIAWAKEHLKFERIVFVEGCTDYEEMFLMSCCGHNIIANSSFSWWGAWLNPNKDKVVVAPRQWVNADIGGRTPVPASWVRI